MAVVSALGSVKSTNGSTGGLNMESIAGKLAYFHEQIHLIHWQTKSFAEHKATGEFYEYLQDFKDNVIEQLMGCIGARIKSLTIEPISTTIKSMDVVSQVMAFATDLMNWADSNGHIDVSNLAQELYGKAAKTKYLLTLS